MLRDPQCKTGILYRMVMPDHTGPYGLKSKDLLERVGFEVEGHYLKTRAETDAFKREPGGATTPQTFIGTGAGPLMTAMVWNRLSVPSALSIGTTGAVSVFKAVYLDERERERKRACVGGDSTVPLGFVSLTETLMMVAMAVVMEVIGLT